MSLPGMGHPSLIALEVYSDAIMSLLSFGSACAVAGFTSTLCKVDVPGTSPRARPSSAPPWGPRPVPERARRLPPSARPPPPPPPPPYRPPARRSPLSALLSLLHSPAVVDE